MSFPNLLRQRADVHRLRYNLSVDTFGQALNPSSYVVFDNIPCRLSQPVLRTGAGNAERDDEAHRLQERTFVCYMGPEMLDIFERDDSFIKSKDRLVIDGRSFEIEKVMPRADFASMHHLEIAVQEIFREQEEDI